MIPFHRGTETARRAGVDDHELARRRLAGQDWCSRHDDGAGGVGAFVLAREMSHVPNQCRACVTARARAARHARKQRRREQGQDAGR